MSIIEIPRRDAQPSGVPIALTRELVARGFTDTDIAAALRRQEIERLSRGAYCPKIRAGDRHQQAMDRYLGRVSARMLGLAGKVVSHRSAAALYGLPLSEALMDEVHVTRDAAGGSRRRPGLVVHAAPLRPDEIVTRSGCLVTTPARTVTDLARSLPLPHVVRLVDAALNRKVLSVNEVQEAVRRAEHRRGMSAARRALRGVDGRSESVGESEFRLHVGALGFPKMALQIEVFDADGTWLARVDAGYPDIGLLIEFDGLVKYQSDLRPGESASQTVVREKRREDLLRGAGFSIVRVEWGDLREPQSLRQRLSRAWAHAHRSAALGAVRGRCVPRPPLTIEI